MNNDMFDTYFKKHILPVPKSNSFDNRTWATLNTLQKKRHSVRSAIGVFAFQVAMIVVLFVIVMPGGQAILSTPWLKAYSSEDGQQYIVEGVESPAGMIEEANATYNEGIWTESFSELEEFLGVEVKVSLYESGEWKPKEYYGMQATEGLVFSVKYENQRFIDRSLYCSMRVCYDIQEEYDHQQYCVQDGVGQYDEIQGNQVYCEYDGERGLWTVRAIVDSCVIEAQGHMSLEEAKAVTKTLLDSYRSLSKEEQRIWMPTGEKDGHPLELITTDLDEMNAFCGNRFMLPDTVPKEWEISSLYVNISDYLTTAILRFMSKTDPDRSVMISINKPDEPGSFTMNYEQNGQGKVIRYRGKEIYVSYNMDRILTVHLEDNTFYAIIGSINLDEVKMFYDCLFRIR